MSDPPASIAFSDARPVASGFDPDPAWSDDGRLLAALLGPDRTEAALATGAAIESGAWTDGARRTGEGVWRLVSESGARFEIEVGPPREHPAATRHGRSDRGLDHLAFHADSDDDVDRPDAVLVGQGWPVDEPLRHDDAPRYDAVGSDDPGGIRLEVVHDPSSTP